ncbi:hypothetical protein JRO89_XS05G0172900 [Xanthoceras sorbifolium]|uniref:Uncharacterized protein n=1 Tax=Xanthoceras sorbifolium TaxID=99658 RepID=A0ABQ8I296_9ROSI|nr:hypothetical protein JRO89_XS05G0172900 [Xanthoceras sorbifolium]
MAAESSNTGFHPEHALNRHAISFQSDAINSSSEVIPMGNFYGVNASTAGMILPGNSSMIGNSPGLVRAGSSSSSLLLDSIPGLKHDTGLAVEWSIEEQYKLEEGLVKFATRTVIYADEPSIMKYIKIAATLPDKTVRDVALRCRWMTRKRRKSEEHNVGKKANHRKLKSLRKKMTRTSILKIMLLQDKLVELNSKATIPLALPQNMATYPLTMHYLNHNERIPFEVLGISGSSRHLLEQNAQAFNQISANLSSLKLQDNIELFCRTRNNITSILNDMRDMPGIMSQMPPLPVSINDDLANSILPNTTQVNSNSDCIVYL